MKKLLNILVLVLALNFVGAVGGVAYLCSAGRLNRDKALAIKAILFPPPATQSAGEINSPLAPASQPTLRVGSLLAQAATRPAGEQVDFLQRKIDMQVLQLDERERQLNDLENQVRLARQQAQQDREALAKQQAAQLQQEELAAKQKQDKGFTDALKLYTAMSARQAKQIFMTLDDETVIRYLGAMQPTDAAKIVKEFKTDPEIKHIQTILEKMRKASATQPATPAPAEAAAAGSTAAAGQP